MVDRDIFPYMLVGDVWPLAKHSVASAAASVIKDEGLLGNRLHALHHQPLNDR